MFGLADGWTARWYNAQLIFNAQTDGSGAQKALTAMQMMDIEPTYAAHDALGDAYHTALVCQRLRLAEESPPMTPPCRRTKMAFPRRAELPGCVGRAVFHGYGQDRRARRDERKENRCPVWWRQMTAGKWYTQQGRRYLTKAHCETDGDFYIRVRPVHEDEALRVSRLVYEPTEQVAKSWRRARPEAAGPTPAPAQIRPCQGQTG